MADLIDREAAISITDYAVDEHPYKDPGKPETYCAYNEGWNDACDYIRARLESVKAAEAVEIVRCRNCAKDDLPTCFLCYIENHAQIFINHDPEFFCGAGERKDSEENG